MEINVLLRLEDGGLSVGLLRKQIQATRGCAGQIDHSIHAQVSLNVTNN